MRESLDALVAEMIDKGIQFEEACAEFERRFIHKALHLARGNRSLAAQTLGIHRNTLSRRLQELELPAPKPAPLPRAGARASRA